jgi:hypothetical protein
VDRDRSTHQVELRRYRGTGSLLDFPAPRYQAREFRRNKWSCFVIEILFGETVPRRNRSSQLRNNFFGASRDGALIVVITLEFSHIGSL